jgi:hypothetical protein
VPARLMDTRGGVPTIDGQYVGGGPVGPGQSVSLTVAGRGGVPASGVGAVVVNVTATQPTSDGFITVWPTGQPRPTASNVNFTAGETIPNLAIAQVGANGQISLYNYAGNTQLVIDVMGWLPLAPNQPDSNVRELPAGTAVVTSGGSGTGSATLEIAADQQVVVGNIVTAVTPDGPYYGRVTATAGHTATTTEVALADVIPILDLSLTADTNTGTVTAQSQTTAAAVSQFAVEPSQTAVLHNSKFNCDAQAKASVTADIDSNPGNFVFDVHLNKFKTGLQSARVGYNPYLTATVTAEATGSVTCNASAYLAGFHLPNISFTIGPVPVLITQKLDVSATLSLTANAAAKRTITATQSAFIGVDYTDGEFHRVASMDFAASDTTTIDAGIDFAFGLPLTYQARLYGLTGFNATLTPKLTLQYRPLDAQYLTLLGQIDIGLSANFDLDLYVVTFKKSKEFLTATVYGPKDLWHKTRGVPPPTTSGGGTTTSTTAPPLDGLTAIRSSGFSGMYTHASGVSCPEASPGFGMFYETEGPGSTGGGGSYVGQDIALFFPQTPGTGTVVVKCVEYDGHSETVVRQFAPIAVTTVGVRSLPSVSSSSVARGSSVTFTATTGCGATPLQQRVQIEIGVPGIDGTIFRSIGSAAVDGSGAWGPITVQMPTDLSPGVVEYGYSCLPTSGDDWYDFGFDGGALTIT